MFKEIKVFFKFFTYLSPQLKKNFPIIILSTILLGFLEMVSVSMIIPIILIILDLKSEKFLQILDEEWKHFNLKLTRIY